MNAHSDPIDRTGRHRAPRQNPLRAALRNFLDRTSGTPRRADVPETGDQCIYCLRFTYYPGYGCTACGRGLNGDDVERYDEDRAGCPGCGRPSGGQWCEDCIDAADAEPLGQFTGDDQ